MEEQVEKKDISKVWMVLAIVAMFGVCIFLALTIQVSSTNMSPEIYFYVDEPVTIDIVVEIPDGVTLTVPEVPLGERIVWEGVYVDPSGSIHFEGREYPFLYYEGIFHYAESNYGWLVQKVDGQMYLNNEAINERELEEFLAEQLATSGLYQHEIDYLMGRVAENDMLDFSKEYLFIRYIPTSDVDEAIKLTISHDFAIMRRHFLLQELDYPVISQKPVYETVKDTGFLIHETAINHI